MIMQISYIIYIFGTHKKMEIEYIIYGIVLYLTGVAMGYAISFAQLPLDEHQEGKMINDEYIEEKLRNVEKAIRKELEEEIFAIKNV